MMRRRFLSFLFFAACMLFPVLSTAETEVKPVLKAASVGDLIQSLDFEDIDGRKGTTEDYKDWIIVYSFADRKSNKDLMAWIGDAGMGVAKAHPELKVAYINFADVTMVPGALRHLITPFLRLINRRSTDQMMEAYKKQGVKLEPDKLRFVMIPDWTGRYLKEFGLENARDYRSYVAVGGKVMAIFDEKTDDIQQSFIRFFDRIVKSLPLIGSFSGSPAEKEPPASGEAAVPPGNPAGK